MRDPGCPLRGPVVAFAYGSSDERVGEMPRSRQRTKAQRPQARKTQTEQQRASERKQITLRQYRMRRVLGWSLVGLALVIGVSHWLAHIGAWGFASQGVMDLVAGYPVAAALGVLGAIILTKA